MRLKKEFLKFFRGTFLLNSDIRYGCKKGERFWKGDALSDQMEVSTHVLAIIAV